MRALVRMLLRKGSVTGYKDGVNDAEQSLMYAVVGGPVFVAIEADQSAFQLYSSGVSTACGTSVDHGVLAVGYGTMPGVLCVVMGVLVVRSRTWSGW